MHYREHAFSKQDSDGKVSAAVGALRKAGEWILRKRRSERPGRRFCILEWAEVEQGPRLPMPPSY
jgi:hypothetical protein